MTTTATTKTKSTTSKTKAGTAEVLIQLPPNPFAFEVFSLASKQRTNAKKIEVLKKYEHPSLKALFIWNFDESIISVLPPGDVPLKQNMEKSIKTMEEENSNAIGFFENDNSTRSTIRKEFKYFYNFIQGGNDSLSGVRREMMFINLIEGLHPLEAEIICLVKDKRLQEKYKITKENASQAYPDISWGGRS
jgi:hypothetical protein